MHDVIVLGGGISGLTAAWKLRQAGLDVLVLEAGETAGGNIRSFDHEGFRLEAGPYCFLGSNDSVWELVGELGLEPLLEHSAPAASQRFIFRDGRLLTLPFSPLAFLGSPLLSLRGKLRLMAEPFIPSGARDLDTAWDFFVRRFGVEAASFLMGPFVSGIYAGDPKMLGARAAFPKFHNFEREQGSMIRGSLKFMIAKRRRMKREGIKPRPGLFSFTGGLGTLTATLAAQLGPALRLATPAAGVSFSNGIYTVRSASGEEWTARAIVSAVPPPQAAALLGALEPRIEAPLMAIPMSPVTLIQWSQPQSAGVPPPGFGFLMPRLYDLRVLGTVFVSQIFPSRAPAGQMLLSSFYGGMLDRTAMELSDAQVGEMLLAEHSRIFGKPLAPPQMLRIARYPGAIPQLLPDHPERMDILSNALAAVPGLFMAGNYLSGVGVEHAVSSGYSAAQAALAFIGGRAVRSSEAA